jgi:hypothetical protein
MEVRTSSAQVPAYSLLCLELRTSVPGPIIAIAGAAETNQDSVQVQG